MEKVPYDARLARACVPSLTRWGVTPNQMTTLSLLLGLAGAGLFALGDGAAANWGAGLFVLARVLDHFDGELARYSGQTSRFGYYYDYVTGMLSYALLFAAIGYHLSLGPLGLWAWLIGGLAAGIAALSMPINLLLDREKGLTGGRAIGYPGFGGFELEDGIYLLAPITWLGLLGPFFVLVGVGATVYALWSLWSLIRLRMARGSSSALP